MSARTLATASHTGLKAKRVCIRYTADMRIRITRLSPSFSGRRHSVVVLTIPLTATSRPRSLHRAEPLYDDLGKTESIHASANTEYIVSDGRKDGAAAPQKTSYPGRDRASVRVTLIQGGSSVRVVSLREDRNKQTHYHRITEEVR